MSANKIILAPSNTKSPHPLAVCLGPCLGTILWVAVMTITPDLAKKWLTQTDPTRNPRKIIDRQEKKFSRIIKMKRWLLNGTTIVFNAAGNLFDGQHRLKACVDSGTPFTTLVVWGVKDEAHANAGVPEPATSRWVGLKKNVNTLSAVLSLLWKFYETGSVKGMLSWKGFIHADEIHRMLEQHPEVEKSVAATIQYRPYLKASYAGALHYLFSQENREKADAFFKELTTENFGPNRDFNPTYHLHDRLTKAKISKAATHQLSSENKVALVIKAWNFYKLDQTCQRLIWSALGYNAEQFPEPGATKQYALDKILSIQEDPNRR